MLPSLSVHRVAGATGTPQTARIPDISFPLNTRIDACLAASSPRRFTPKSRWISMHSI